MLTHSEARVEVKPGDWTRSLEGKVRRRWSCVVRLGESDGEASLPRVWRSSMVRPLLRPGEGAEAFSYAAKSR